MGNGNIDNMDHNEIEINNSNYDQQQQEEEKKFPEDYYKIDKDLMYNHIRDFPIYLREAYNSLDWLKFDTTFSRLIIAGMGGSGIAGEVLKDYVTEKKNKIITIHDYELVDVNEQDLVVVISYSGNTEEAISCFKEAFSKGAKLVVITSDGKLSNMCREYRVPYAIVPQGIAPRAAFPYLFGNLLKIAFLAGFIQDPYEEIQEAVSTLTRRDLRPTAIEIAKKIENKPLIIYATPSLRAVAYRWKTQFNENAKHIAFFNELPEANHNEIESYRYLTNYFLIILTSHNEKHRMKKRAELTKNLASKYMPVVLFNAKDNKLTSILSMIQLGDWISYYLALWKGLDPTPTPLINEFKKQMGPFV